MLTPILRSSVLSAALALSFGANTYAVTFPDLLENQYNTDYKYYPATFCDSNKPGNIIFTSNGKAVNPSTSTAYEVTCPLINDIQSAVDYNNNYADPNFYDVRIYVNKKSSADIPCYVKSRDRFSETGYIQTYTITGASSNTDYFAYFVDAPSIYHNTVVGCKIPKATSTSASTRSGVTSYSAAEASEYY